jgi:hypothetical protein
MTKKRILSALLAVLLLCTCVLSSACSIGVGDKKSDPKKEKRTNVYAGEDIPLPDDISNINSLSVGSGNAYITYQAEFTAVYNDMGEIVERTPGYDWQANEEKEKTLPEGWWIGYESQQMLLTVDLDKKEAVSAVPFSVDEEEYGWANNYTPGPDGTLVTGSQKWNWDETTETSTNENFILVIDAVTAEVKKVIPLNEVLSRAGFDVNNIYINQFLMTDDAVYLVIDTDVAVLDTDGNFRSKLDGLQLNDGWIQGMWKVGNRIVFAVYSGGKQFLKVFENGQFTDLKSDALALAGTSSPMAADDENLYYSTSTGISAYNFASDTYGEVLNYINSDIENTGNTCFLPDGRLLVATTDWGGDKAVSTLSLLSRVPDEELAEEIILRLGCVYVDYNLKRSIIRYNKQNTGIRVSVVDYSPYNNEDNEYTGAVTKFNNDIATGDVPDLVLLNAQMPTESYLRKNTFVNLYKYIDDEENGIDRSKYLTNIWEASETDGKLNSMILTYSLNTLLAKSEIVGTEPGWTFEEMMQAIASMPEGGRAFYEYSRDQIIDNFFQYSMDSFINWDTGETYFDTPGFIDFVKYLATCPEKNYWETRYGDDYVYDPDTDRAYEEEYAMRYKNNMALFSMGNYSDFTGYLYTRNEFASKDVTAVGYPRNGEGNGSVIIPDIELAIATKSQAKDQAWEVLKFFLTDDALLNPGWQFSVSRSAMADQRSNAKETYGDYMPSDSDFDWMREEGYSDDYIEYQKNSRQPYDDAAADYVMTLIEGSKSIARTDSALVDIVKEELSAVFAGSKPAETAAKQIASRAGIYVSEHR